MPLLIKKAHDPITVGSIKVLLFGQPGVRKTSYAFTAPRPLLIDCDGGIRRVGPQYRGDYVEVKSWEDIAEVLNHQLVDYDTLIFDTVSKMLDFATAQVIKNDARLKRKDGNLSQQGYGALGILFKGFVGRASSMGKNLVFVAHDKENRNGDEVTIRPDITGSSLGTIIKDMDLVGYMETYNNLSTVAFSPTDKHYGKNTCGLPDRIETQAMPLDLIFETYKESVNRETEELKIHRQQMTEVEAQLTEVKTCEELNAVLNKVLKMEFALNGKVIAAQMVKTKAEEIPCVYEGKRGEGKYVAAPEPQPQPQLNSTPETVTA